MDNITYEDFRKLDIRVVRVLDAENIPGKDYILKLTIETSPRETRTVIAGGAEYYKPDHYIGRKLVALVNLKPRKIAGIKSQGMLLAAEVEGKPIWLMPEADVPVGSKIR